LAKRQAPQPERVRVDHPADSDHGPTSAQQVEHLAILALALVFALIGLAVHFFLFGAIVLMAILFGLSASGLRGRRNGGVISGVAATVVAEAKRVAESIANPELDESDPKDLHQVTKE